MALTRPTTTQVTHPNPVKHLAISLIKSVFRIVAGVLLCAGQIYAAGALLILAEILGIAEELV
jgi:hypothetical protein